MKTNISISKTSLRFSVEVIRTRTGAKVSVTRFIDVAPREDMSTNAQLAKYDSIQVKGHHYNCNELIKSVIHYLERSMNIEKKSTPLNTLL